MEHKFYIRVDGSNSPLGPFTFDDIDKKTQEGNKFSHIKEKNDQAWTKISSQYDLQIYLNQFRSDNKIFDYKNVSFQEPEIDYTNIRNRINKNKAVKGTDKTVVSEKFKKFPKEETQKKKEKKNKEKVKNKNEVVNRRSIFEQATKLTNVLKYLPILKKDAKKIENELREPAISVEIEGQPEDANKKNKRKKLLTFGLILLVVLLIPKEEKNKENFSLSYRVPVDYKDLDREASVKEFNKAKDWLRKGSFRGKAQAIDHLIKSLEYQFNENPSLGFLILTYAELLENVRNPQKARKVLFDLIKRGRSLSFKDVNFVTGTGLFFLKSGRELAGINSLEDYLRLNKAISLKLLSVYLELNLRTGRFETAEKVLKKIEKVEQGKWTAESFLAVYQFYKYNQNLIRAEKTLRSGIDLYPDNFKLNFSLVQLMIEREDFRELPRVISVLKGSFSEFGPYQRGKFFEILGIHSVISGNFEQGAQYFRKALNLNKNSEIEQRLAVLEVEGSNTVKKMIAESKAKSLILTASNHLAQKKYKQAFTLAIEASEIDENYLPAKIFLAKVNSNQGFASRAIAILDEILKLNPLHREANFALLEILIDSFKLGKANELFLKLSSTRLNQYYEYDHLLGKYYKKNDNFLKAIEWFSNAASKDPLQDKNYFELAEIYYRFKKFNDAKYIIRKALEIDPRNDLYLSLYSEILYETEGIKTAIGFLRESLKQDPTSEILKAQIAIYYYKVGDNKNYKETRKEISKINEMSESLLSFLIKIEKLNDNINEVVKLYRDLINRNPGNLKARFELGVHYYLLKSYDLSIRTFRGLERRLESYPQLHYYLSKIYFDLGKLDQSMLEAEREIELNPYSEYGFIAKGKILVKQQKFLLAQEQFNKAIQLNRDSEDAIMNLAWIKFHQNFIDEALGLYRRAEEINSSNALIYRQMGHIYERKGQGQLAIESYRVYLKLNPDARDRGRVEGLIRKLK